MYKVVLPTIFITAAVVVFASYMAWHYTAVHIASNAVKSQMNSAVFQQSLEDACRENPKLYRCLLKR